MEPENTTPKIISVIVPAYNEEDTVEKTIRRLLDTELGIEKEVVVIDDGSTDSTGRILEGMKGIKALTHRENQGKGQAVKTGIENACGDIAVIQDADLEYDPAELAGLVQTILEGEADVVYGSRFLKEGAGGYRLYTMGNKVISLFASLALGRRMTDVETCYKVFPLYLFNDYRIQSKGFDVEIELTILFFKKGLRMVEQPISYLPRSHELGKKIGVKDGVIAVAKILYYRLFMNA